MSDTASARPRDLAKWALFAVLGLLVLWSAWIDDRFVFNGKDPEWAKFRDWWPLLPHAVGALPALLIGPLQFSDTLRARRPAVHRWLGRVYAGAALIAGPLGALIAVQHHTPALAAAQVAQGGLWALCTAMALLFALQRDFTHHKLWMMRSYGFALVFVIGRLPDAIPHFPWDDAPGITVSWAGVVLALVGPDLILAARAFLRRRKAAA